jgi:hypothetical protein
MAEAYHQYKAGTAWWPFGNEDELFRAEQEARFNEDAWTDPIIEFVEEVRRGMEKSDSFWETGFTVMEVARKLGFREWKEVNGQINSRIVSVLEHMGCTKRLGPLGKPIEGSKGKTWLPPPRVAKAKGDPEGGRERA